MGVIFPDYAQASRRRTTQPGIVAFGRCRVAGIIRRSIIRANSITPKGRSTARKMRITRRKNCGKNSLPGINWKQTSAAQIGKKLQEKRKRNLGGKQKRVDIREYVMYNKCVLEMETSPCGVEILNCLVSWMLQKRSGRVIFRFSFFNPFGAPTRPGSGTAGRHRRQLSAAA